MTRSCWLGASSSEAFFGDETALFVPEWLHAIGAAQIDIANVKSNELIQSERIRI